MTTTAERTRRVIADQFGDPDCLSDEYEAAHARFIEDLGADSLDVLELKLRLEAEFPITIDGYLDDLMTVGAVVKFMEDLIDGEQP